MKLKSRCTYMTREEGSTEERVKRVTHPPGSVFDFPGRLAEEKLASGLWVRAEEAPSPAPHPIAGSNEAEKQSAVAIAIQSLDPEDESLWNQDGSPKIAAVREVGGDSLASVTSEEVRAVWARLQAG